MNGIMGRRFILYLSIVATGFVVDMATKWWAFDVLGPPPRVAGAPANAGEVAWIWPKIAGFQTSLNEGALFGLGQGAAPIFAGMSLLALAAILAWLFVWKAAGDRTLTIVLAATSAGILGNLYDRLGLHGLVWQDPGRVGQRAFAVRDFILVQVNHRLTWPNFNVADSMIFCSMAALCWLTWRRGSPAPDAAQRPVADSGAD